MKEVKHQIKTVKETKQKYGFYDLGKIILLTFISKPL